MNKFSKVRDLVMSLEGDFEKFYEKGNSAAGTRVRKGMQDLKNLAQELRKEVQDMKNSSGEEEAAK
ncbi:MAG: histone H1 [Cytophagales bacterium CG18_big_fil_WC_8_21_14_2_50_42_9]|nr:MAG: histone H1 [Cytophagales bacterium CG18_big_fil_WC_8_21_14_2_50_42_9]